MIKRLYYFLRSFFTSLSKDNIALYSAYASFYVVISFVPFLIMVLMLAGEFISLTSADFAEFAGHSLPKNVISFITYLIDEILSSDNVKLISVPLITLIWTASRTVVAVIKGVDCVYKVPEGRGFIRLNLAGIFYTFMFLVAIMFSLLIMVFGNVVGDALSRIFPFAVDLIDKILSTRSIVSLVALTVFFACVYTFFPAKKQRFTHQLPGALFSASGWMIFSLIFSIYIDNFSNKSYVYGSLTALIVLMLWIYFCMMIMFLGGEINYFLMKEKGKVDTSSSL